MSDFDALDAIMAVMEVGFDPHWREAWTRSQVCDSLQMPSTFALVLDSAGSRTCDPDKATGFVLSRQALDEEELLLLAVSPTVRGRGLGRRLVEAYLDNARYRGTRRIFLEMRANNPAQSLYRRTGFLPIGTRPRYYRTADGQMLDAITFARRL